MFGKKKVIGIDIGTTYIKAVELDVGKKKTKVISMALCPTPADSYDKGSLLDIASLSVAIKNLIGNLKTKRKIVATGICGSSALVKQISIPRVDEKLIFEQLQWEAEQYIPHDMSEVSIDFKALNLPSESPDSMEIILVAAVQAESLKYLELMEGLGLKCSILDINGLALANSFIYFSPEPPRQNTVLLDVGSHITNLVVLQDSDVIAVMDLPVGGNLYTTEIERAMGVSSEEAEALKLGSSNQEATPSKVAEVIGRSHSLLFNEVDRALQSCQPAGRPDFEISKIYFTGGGSLIPGLKSLFDEIYKTDYINPWASSRLEVSSSQQDIMKIMLNLASVALGLGMRSQGDRKS